MADNYADSIRFEESRDGLKSVVLTAIQSHTELVITAQPDGEISLAALVASNQYDFCIPPNELGALAMQWLGLSSSRPQPGAESNP